MAFANMSEELNCSICLNIYKDPVVLRCGHNFCCNCIRNVLDTQEGSRVYSCPECRTKFEEHPALHRNIALRNIAEHFLSTSPEQETSRIFCGYCINSSVPAVKTCVNCEASLCEGHVKVHIKSAEHVLIDPTTCLKNRKCSIHKKILEYYCCDDSLCICLSCRLDGIHKGHQVELINVAFEKKRKKIKNDLDELSLQNAEAKRRMQTLVDHEIKVKRNAVRVEKRFLDWFRETHKKLDTLEKRVLDEIARQEEEVSSSTADLIQHLEAELDKFSKKIMMAEKLCNMTDPLNILQEHGADKDFNTKTDGRNDFERRETEDNVVKDFHEEVIFITMLNGLFHIVNQVKMGVSVQIYSDIILDVDTAGNNVNVSEDLKTVSWVKKDNVYPPSLKKFSFNQVLSETSFSSGQRYWEVETGEAGNWRLGVAYSSIERIGDHHAIGSDGKSWCLRRFNGKCGVMHDHKEISLPHRFTSQDFAVFLDYEVGRLSFYELCEPVRHLHTFSATFTEPLHAAFLVNKSFVKIKSIKLHINSPEFQ